MSVTVYKNGLKNRFFSTCFCSFEGWTLGRHNAALHITDKDASEEEKQLSFKAEGKKDAFLEKQETYLFAEIALALT